MPQLLERLDQRRLGVAGRRLGGVALGVERRRRVSGWPSRSVRQPALASSASALGVVATLDVGAQEPGERDGRAGRGERRPSRRSAAVPAEPHRDASGRRRRPSARRWCASRSARRAGTRRRRARRRARRGCGSVAGRTDRLVRLLRVLHLASCSCRGCVGHVRVAVQLARPGPGRRRSPSRDSVVESVRM